MSEAARPVLHILAWLLLVLGLAMLFPVAVDLYADNRDWQVFAAGSCVTLTTGGLVLLATRGRFTNLTVRQAFVLTTASWVVVPAFAALPFLFGVGGIGYADAMFEAVSGNTTTGATVLVGLADLPPGGARTARIKRQCINRRVGKASRRTTNHLPMMWARGHTPR